MTDPQESRPVARTSSLLELFSLPNQQELQACWELCRLHNNIGFWVVWLPTAWSIAMFYHANPAVSGLICLQVAGLFVPLCFGIKSLIMAIDDILDYDIDAMVERTKNRPIPRGSITIERACFFFALQVSVGVYMANTFLKQTTLRISMVVWPLYIIYPTCKRWMNFAPIPLGVMFAIGTFMGWSQLSPDGNVPWNVLTPVYLSCVCWTIAYETVYQHQDKVDDLKIGIHSPALFCAEYTIPICLSSAVLFLSLLAYGGALNGHGAPFYLSVLAAAMRLLHQLSVTNIDIPKDCQRLFLGTPQIGQIVLVGLVTDGILQRWLRSVPL
ncbi:UbiA prenyltransferase family-domain-containing protein [Lyophyllum atratum]|nr:UbiA prenyltransferase family-domain-containing protein [Lyophyllum atratum]